MNREQNDVTYGAMISEQDNASCTFEIHPTDTHIHQVVIIPRELIVR